MTRSIASASTGRATSGGGGDRDRVLAATDLVALIGEHVALRQRGREWVGLCPFHDDRTPSLSVVIHKREAFYKCFACGAAGNAIDFAMEFLRMDFPTALRHLAGRAGIALSDRPRRTDAGGVGREELVAANEAALRHWRSLLVAARAGRSANAAAIAAARIIAERGIADAMVEQFQLGAASSSWDDLSALVRARGLDLGAFLAAGLLKARSEGQGHFDMFRNRVIFPIADEIGRPVAFGGRRIDPEENPKYLNSAESELFRKSRTLYGLHLAKRPIIDSGTAIVTEGYTDVIACHQHGFRNVVATLGTALTVEHARVLRRLCSRVVLLFDGDEAGRKAADRAAEVFFSEPVDVGVCVLPGGADPDDLLRSADGPARFAGALDAGVDVLEYLVDRFMEHYRGAESLSARQRSLEAFLARLVDLGLDHANDLRRRFILDRIAALLALPVALLERSMPRPPRGNQQGSQSRTPPQSPLRIESGAARSPEGGGAAWAAESSAGGSGEAGGAAVPRALLKAEQFLLTLLLRHPELASERIDAGDGHLLPIPEAIGPGHFADPLHRALAEILMPMLDAHGEALSLTSLLSEVARPELRDLASTLYLSGSAPGSGVACAFHEARAPTAADGSAEDDEAGRSDRRSPQAPSDRPPSPRHSAPLRQPSSRPDVPRQSNAAALRSSEPHAPPISMLRQACLDLDRTRRRLGLADDDRGRRLDDGAPLSDLDEARARLESIRLRGPNPGAIGRPRSRPGS
ncbi:MAG TPA: DNA primase [Phycisphaerales bacterium]|nr:DNA primase [Phycisphaerales bacterium]HMP38101.1 DNA primase [Phycisphaerales bacterium]